MTEYSVNLATGYYLLPFVDKYLAEVAKRRPRPDDDTSPVDAPARKAACAAAPADERYALAIKSLAASSEEELESLQKLLTAEIEKRKRPVSLFFDTRTAAAASSSR